MQDARLIELAERFRVSECIAVERREDGTWAVVHGKSNVINVDLAREFEPSPVQRTKAFLDRTRFSLERAFEIAEAFQRKISAPRPLRSLETVMRDQGQALYP